MEKNGKSVSTLEVGQIIEFAGKTKIKIIELEGEVDGKRVGVISVVKAWVEQDYLLGDKFQCSFENAPGGGLHIHILEDSFHQEKKKPQKKTQKKVDSIKKPAARRTAKAR